MKYVDEFRRQEDAVRLLDAVAARVTKPWTLMEICGGQTHTIIKTGIDQLLPDLVTLVHGPGCPVCVTPIEQIDKALAIAARPEVIFTSFGDMVRVPGSGGDLLSAKSAGADVRMLYSPLDAVKLAAKNPDREVVFFAVGFETTAPANAFAVWSAAKQGITNFSILSSHVLVPPAMEAILSAPDNQVQGFLAAGHVCTVMGYEEYEPIAERHRIPITVTGFEPLDLLQGILMTVTALEEGRIGVENQYRRVVDREGNPAARKILGEVFRVIDRGWRGIGVIPRERLRTGAGLRGVRRRAEVRRGGCVRARVAGVHRGRCSAGDQASPRLPRVRHPLHAREASRRAHGLVGRRVRGLLHVQAARMSETPSMPDPSRVACPIPIQDYPTVQLAHGGGGRLSKMLVETLFVPAFDNAWLSRLHDGAVLDVPGGRMAYTTDSYVIRPLEFPGGDIGSLSIHGTVNDLAMCGARPTAISVGYILEEGLDMELLWRVVQSMRDAAAEVGVPIVTGDTKVVDRGKGDGIYINTSGIGVIPAGIELDPTNIRPGDKVLLSGEIAVHGVTILSVREGLEFETTLETDSAPLDTLVQDVLAVAAGDVHVFRDPTRGGVASTLNEIADSAGSAIVLDERAIPLSDAVRGACEILGLDPLYVANEGKCLAIVAPQKADAALAAMRAHPRGRDAAIIGEVVKAPKRGVHLKSRIGGMRIVDLMSGEQLPRIC